jgi:translation initiation factor 6
LSVIQLDINGNPFIGVWCCANDRIALVPQNATKSNIRKITKALDVEVVAMSIGGTDLMGSLIALNSKGAVVTNFVEQGELELMEKHIRVGVLEHKLNATGNIILANDNGALIHPGLDDLSLKLIKETLGVPVRKGTIAGLATVGAAALTTNEGILCHPKLEDDEKTVLEELFRVSVDIGTANYGTPLIGACLIANTKGAITGYTSTGIELGRIESALNLIDK